ncbi:MAG: hypothetical protein P8N64_03355 [Flavobacteriaceae bacterium]|nr:hypothetical protein [Flavobacteriaceae bacterium]
MKKLVLVCISFIFISCVSVKFPETLSVNVKLDKESAKNLTQAINNSNYKTTMMAHHKEKGIAEIESIILNTIDEDVNESWVKDDGEKLKKVMIIGEKFGEGPNASKYMNDLPKVIIQRIENATDLIRKNSLKGINIIKIDTIISDNGERKEIKIELKIDDN